MQVSEIVAFMFSKISSSFSVENILKRNSVRRGGRGEWDLQEDQEEGYFGNLGEKHRWQGSWWKQYKLREMEKWCWRAGLLTIFWEWGKVEHQVWVLTFLPKLWNGNITNLKCNNLREEQNYVLEKGIKNSDVNLLHVKCQCDIQLKMSTRQLHI